MSSFWTWKTNHTRHWIGIGRVIYWSREKLYTTQLQLPHKVIFLPPNWNTVVSIHIKFLYNKAIRKDIAWLVYALFLCNQNNSIVWICVTNSTIIYIEFGSNTLVHFSVFYIFKLYIPSNKTKWIWPFCLPGGKQSWKYAKLVSHLV
jgi:hypothetical protein